MNTVALSEENEQFLQAQIAAGRFPTVDAALDAAVELWRSRDSLTALIEERYQQIERGEYTDYDSESLRARFDELKAVARRSSQPAIGS